MFKQYCSRHAPDTRLPAGAKSMPRLWKNLDLILDLFVSSSADETQTYMRFSINRDYEKRRAFVANT